MDEIRVNTSDLRNGFQRLSSVAEEIGVVQRHVASLSSRVTDTYGGQFRRALESVAGDNFQAETLLRARAIELGDELLKRAIGFDAANEAGHSAMLVASANFVDVMEKSAIIKLLSSITNLRQKANSIWTLAGFELGSLTALLFVTTKPEISTPFVGTTMPTTSFGDILKQVEEKRLQQAQWAVQRKKWWETNGLNQIATDVFNATLKYGNPYNACGAATLAMLINYTSFAQNKADNKVDPAELVRIAGQKGYFNDKLLSFRELGDLAGEKGFIIEPALEASGNAPLRFDDFKKQVQMGNPHIVLVKYVYDKNGNYVPNLNSTTNKDFDHFIIVTDISDEKITIINPHPGKSQTSNSDVIPTYITVDDFRKIWAYDPDQMMGQGFSLQAQ